MDISGDQKGGSDLSQFSKMMFSIQWDCIDDEINTLYNLSDGVVDNALQASGFSNFVQRVEGDLEDQELHFEGDLLLNCQDGYFDLL